MINVICNISYLWETVSSFQKKKEQHKTKLAVGLVIFGFAGILLRYKKFESQTEPKYNFLKPKTLDPSLFFLKQTSQSEIVFQERKAQNVILVQLYYL